VCGGLLLVNDSPAAEPRPADEHAAGSTGADSDGRALLPAADDAARDGDGGGDDAATRRRQLVLGTVLNLSNMVLDVLGAMLSTHGAAAPPASPARSYGLTSERACLPLLSARRFGVGCSTWQVSLVRFGAAAAMTSVGCVAARAFAATRGVPAPSWAVLPVQDRQAWTLVAVGAFLVTFLAAAAGNYALFGLPLGVWSALSSLGPVYTVPVLWLLRREPTHVRTLAGSATATAGAIILSRAARGG
jgi:drug/metabolite transporter (DMT)-like permease